MKKLAIFLGVAGALFFGSFRLRPSRRGWKRVDGVIVFDTPARVEGQQSVLRLRTAPMDTVRVGFIGLGMRGPGPWSVSPTSTASRSRPCATSIPERVEKAQEILVAQSSRAAAYSGEEGWKKLCERDDIDLVYIVTPWHLHVPMAVYAMEHGKHVAVEVPAAMSLEECWQLVIDTPRRPAPLHDARKLRLRLLRAHDAQHGPARALRRDPPCRRCVYPQPRRVLGLLSGQLASGLQPEAPRRRLRHARPRSRLPAARHPPRRQDDLPRVDGHPVGQRAEDRQGEAWAPKPSPTATIRRRSSRPRRAARSSSRTQCLYAPSLQPHVPADRYRRDSPTNIRSGLCLPSRPACGFGRARPREPERPPFRVQGGA